MQCREDTDNRSVCRDARAQADKLLMHHAVEFDVHVAFDGVAGERPVLQFADAVPP